MKIVHSMWNKNPKFKGLQIMTLGFIGAMSSAGVLLLGGFLHDRDFVEIINIAGIILLYFGWSGLAFCAFIMFFGIVMHWITMFNGKNEI